MRIAYFAQNEILISLIRLLKYRASFAPSVAWIAVVKKNVEGAILPST